MTDVMERLRAANPIAGCPPPPIEDVWRRVDADSPVEPVIRSTPPARRRAAFARLRGVAVLSVSVAVVIAVVAILLVGHGQTSPQGQPRPAAGETAPATGSPRTNHAGITVDPTIASRFSVLTAAPKAGDILPAGYRAELSNYRTLGPEPGGARRVTASDGQTAYLVPARHGACALTSSAPICAPAGHLAGAYAMDLCSPTLPAGEIELQWLLPDGATNVTVRLPDGVLSLQPSGYNVYITYLKTATVPQAINWIQNGQHNSVDVGGIGGNQVGKCAHPRDVPPASQLPATRPGPVTKTATVVTTTGPGTATLVLP